MINDNYIQKWITFQIIEHSPDDKYFASSCGISIRELNTAKKDGYLKNPQIADRILKGLYLSVAYCDYNVKYYQEAIDRLIRTYDVLIATDERITERLIWMSDYECKSVNTPFEIVHFFANILNNYVDNIFDLRGLSKNLQEAVKFFDYYYENLDPSFKFIVSSFMIMNGGWVVSKKGLKFFAKEMYKYKEQANIYIYIIIEKKLPIMIEDCIERSIIAGHYDETVKYIDMIIENELIGDTDLLILYKSISSYLCGEKYIFEHLDQYLEWYINTHEGERYTVFSIIDKLKKFARGEYKSKSDIIKVFSEDDKERFYKLITMIKQVFVFNY